MNMDKARKIWYGYNFTEIDLREWVRLSNEKLPDPPNLHKGETVDVSILVGIEPTTSRLEGECSIQLSHRTY